MEIVHAIERAQGLTRQLLAFSRRQPSEASVVNMGEVVTGFHSMLRRMLSANIEMVTVAGEDLWPVLVDKGQIEQVFMNLAVNARDAMPTGGRFGVEIENCTVVSADQELPQGDYVAMHISDTGTGIEPECLSRIFDPFFTTKERGRGTGLGLSTCYGIVTQAGGSLKVDSKIGVGTTFHVLLPRTIEKTSQPAASAVLSSGPGGRETILIVEDDHAVMRATVATLKNGGYTGASRYADHLHDRLFGLSDRHRKRRQQDRQAARDHEAVPAERTAVDRPRSPGRQGRCSRLGA